MMALEDKHMESALYIAVVPVIINVFVFLMFSRISRLEIPCLHYIIGTQKRELLHKRLMEADVAISSHSLREFAEDETPLDPNFSFVEAIKVGVVYALFLNFILYIIAVILLRDLRASFI